MEKGWYWKVTFVILLLLGSVAYLLPSFIPDALPGWYKSIFQKKINLGLDLQGGIHLVLGVEVDKALEDKADQYVNDFREALKEKRVELKKIYRVPGTWEIVFELAKSEDVKKFKKRILGQYYNLKTVSETTQDDGTSVIRVNFDEKYVSELRKNASAQCQTTVRNRVDEIGVAQASIAPQGDVGILVQLPGEFNPERAKKLLGRTAQLQFRVVDDKSDFFRGLKGSLPEGVTLEMGTHMGPNEEPVTEAYLVAKGKGSEGKTRIVEFLNNVTEIDTFLKSKQTDAKVSEKILQLARAEMTNSSRKEILDLAKTTLSASLAEGSEAFAELEKLLKGKVPEGRMVGFQRTERQLEVEYRALLLFGEVAMTGDYITDAREGIDNDTGGYEVSLTFDRTGAVMFEKLTGAHVRERMAIVLEGEVSSAPIIQTRIAGGNARITMGASMGRDQRGLEEAKELAAVLRAGALPAPVKILEERTVGPTMGEDARRQGSLAMLIGLGLVVLFMIFYYKVTGLIADLALVLNSLIILVCLVAFGATLTLPGIAGIVLTLGMAVDANVIINERIKEELRAGKTPRAAVEAGYSRAFWTIFDSNLTTLIAAFVLMSYGSGPVQGFAVTLSIGLIASMFTAIFVTRIVMDWLVIRRKVQKLSI